MNSEMAVLMRREMVNNLSAHLQDLLWITGPARPVDAR